MQNPPEWRVLLYPENFLKKLLTSKKYRGIKYYDRHSTTDDAMTDKATTDKVTTGEVTTGEVPPVRNGT